MIQAGKIVDLAYVLKDLDGEVLDQADASEPFTYLHGSRQIISGLENALVGLKVGDRKHVAIEPSDAYGVFNPALKMELSRSQFPEGAEIKLGVQFQTEDEDGSPMIFTVEGVEGDSVRVNGNHPLADQRLFFDVEVLNLRDASAEELEHGHAHGPHGHHEHDEHCDHSH